MISFFNFRWAAAAKYFSHPPLASSLFPNETLVIETILLFCQPLTSKERKTPNQARIFYEKKSKNLITKSCDFSLDFGVKRKQIISSSWTSK